MSLELAGELSTLTNIVARHYSSIIIIKKFVQSSVSRVLSRDWRVDSALKTQFASKRLSDKQRRSRHLRTAHCTLLLFPFLVALSLVARRQQRVQFFIYLA
jgi:hypothetical protein